MNGERMNTALELIGQRRVDHAVTFEPGLSPERLRHNIESEMRLAARPMAGMPFMETGFVFNVQAFGRKSRDQLGRYDVLHSHCIPIVRPDPAKHGFAPISLATIKR